MFHYAVAAGIFYSPSPVISAEAMHRRLPASSCLLLVTLRLCASAGKRTLCLREKKLRLNKSELQSTRNNANRNMHRSPQRDAQFLISLCEIYQYRCLLSRDAHPHAGLKKASFHALPDQLEIKSSSSQSDSVRYRYKYLGYQGIVWSKGL